MPGIHVGSRARVELMSGERFDGRVQSIAHAITDRENAEGSRLLANINPSYTWVKLAQRIPVRIAIDPAYRQRNTLRAGVTATIRVLPAEDTAKVDSAAPGLPCGLESGRTGQSVPVMAQGCSRTISARCRINRSSAWLPLCWRNCLASSRARWKAASTLAWPWLSRIHR